MIKIKQLYIDKNHREDNIFSMMGFSNKQNFIQISFMTEPCKMQIENNIIFLEDYHYIILQNDNQERKINIGQTGILELQNIELTQIICSSNIPYLNITYMYED